MGYLGSAERPMKISTDGLVKNWSALPARQTLEKLKNEGSIDLIWHVGDIGYIDDAFAHHPVEFTYEKVYNEYMNWIQNLTAVLPYMVSPGNHESECHSPACIVELRFNALRNFSAFNKRWHMPSQESGGVLNMWYSYNYGAVHFVSINTETDFPGAEETDTGDSHLKFMPAGHFAPNGTYLKWLEADLKAANESRANGGPNWIIVGGHRPHGVVKACCAAMFEKYGVDMYFNGHAHNYVRSLPSNGVTVERHHKLNHYHNAQGTVWITSGAAGSDETTYVVDVDEASGKAKPRATNKISKTEFAPGYTAPVGAEVSDVTTKAMSIGVLTVKNQSMLQWKLYSATSGEVLDELSVTKSS
eukprot:gene13329-15748_t